MKKLSANLALAICRNHNVEVFHVDAATARENRKREGDDAEIPTRAGWYYWTCFPGCLPDSSAFGPFRNAGQAARDAVEVFDLSRQYEYYINLDERGEFYSDVRDELGKSVAEFRSIDAETLWDTERVNLRDILNVKRYLVENIGMMNACDELTKGN